VSLTTLLEQAFRETVLAEAQALPDTEASLAESPAAEGLYVKMATFEGAKGLSAQHVYVVGLHERELPRNAAAITDREVCLFLVALTRAKKKCSILETGRFATAWKQPSVFLGWIQAARLRLVTVDRAFWP
jgi:superfamily I DNA/RNA helicase